MTEPPTSGNLVKADNPRKKAERMECQRSQRNTGGQVIMESKEQMAIRKDERSVLRDPQNHHRISQDASHW